MPTTGNEMVTVKQLKDYGDTKIASPAGGTTGQVLTKTADGEAWQDAQTIDTPVPISQGGTGATTADGARTALGISVADPDELVEYIKSKLGGA